MIGLGIWQLQRARWKEALLARYAQAEKLPPIAWPTVPLRDDQLPLFRHATGVCLRIVGQRAVGRREPRRRARLCPDRRLRDRRRRAGDERRGRLVEGPEREGQLDRRPGQRDHRARPADPACGWLRQARRPGFEPSAPPSLASDPQQPSLLCAQWFAFAAIALIIYGLALRKRLKGGAADNDAAHDPRQWPARRQPADAQRRDDRGRPLRRDRLAQRARRDSTASRICSSIWCSRAPAAARRARSASWSRTSAATSMPRPTAS